MAQRPAIPVDLERRVLIEAGHRCAIPVCRQVPIEIAHIVSYAKCQKHEAHNLIPLCPTCHSRFDAGQIDHKSMLSYKLSLMLVNRRFGDAEARLLEWLGEDRSRTEVAILAEMEILFLHLIRDGLLEYRGEDEQIAGGALVRKKFHLTSAGQGFLEHWIAETAAIGMKA